MADVTEEKLNLALDRQTQAFHGLLQVELQPIRETLAEHTVILNQHTESFDGLVKNAETARIEAAATRAALARHETWFGQIAKKFGMRF